MNDSREKLPPGADIVGLLRARGYSVQVGWMPDPDYPVLDIEQMAFKPDSLCSAAADVIERLRVALIQLRDWDMLTLNADGTGESLDDARWAREIIADALGESIWVDS